jgi:hypothetical protein
MVEFEAALRQHDGDEIAAILDCGRWCAGLGAVREAKKICERLGPNPPLDLLAAALNSGGIGGGNLTARNGDIVGIYKQCYCPSREQLQDKYPFFCHCTRGWAAAIFEDALGHPVDVDLTRAISQGDDCCEFIVHCSVPSD